MGGVAAGGGDTGKAFLLATLHRLQHGLGMGVMFEKLLLHSSNDPSPEDEVVWAECGPWMRLS